MGERLVAAGALVRDRRGSRGRARVQDIARVNTKDLLNRGSRGEREREGGKRHPAATEQPGWKEAALGKRIRGIIGRNRCDRTGVCRGG